MPDNDKRQEREAIVKELNTLAEQHGLPKIKTRAAADEIFCGGLGGMVEGWEVGCGCAARARWEVGWRGGWVGWRGKAILKSHLALGVRLASQFPNQDDFFKWGLGGRTSKTDPNRPTCKNIIAFRV